MQILQWHDCCQVDLPPPHPTTTTTTTVLSHRKPHLKGESSLVSKKAHTAQMHDVYHNWKYKEKPKNKMIYKNVSGLRFYLDIKRKKRDWNTQIVKKKTHTYAHILYCISTMRTAPILSFEVSVIVNSPVDSFEPSCHCEVSMNNVYTPFYT